MVNELEKRISLGKRLRRCPSFRCLGVFANWNDYSCEAMDDIRRATKIFYPSSLYEDLALSLGKSAFPRSYYAFMGNKTKQTNLFQLLGISHPRTKLYYGRNRFERIRRDFPYPFIAKTPVGSSKGLGVRLIETESDLLQYLDKHRPAYIQEYLPIDRDLRVVLLAGHVAHAYWRISNPGEFRNNVSRGGSISYEGVPDEALEFAKDVVRRCRFDEVGLDICLHEGRYYVIEANMAYGLEGFRQVGMDIYEELAKLDREGLL